MGFTDVPDSLGGYLRQRLRWDGDLSYLYFRKHALSFSPRLVGWRNFLSMLWTGLLFQIVMPLLHPGYTACSSSPNRRAALSILGLITSSNWRSPRCFLTLHALIGCARDRT
jgi:cellulose synthase/poly-beta-1,6-N-acetylglucosamine synthase-like glycosyltransferase